MCDQRGCIFTYLRNRMTEVHMVGRRKEYTCLDVYFLLPFLTIRTKSVECQFLRNRTHSPVLGTQQIINHSIHVSSYLPKVSSASQRARQFTSNTYIVDECFAWKPMLFVIEQVLILIHQVTIEQISRDLGIVFSFSVFYSYLLSID